MTSLLLQSGKFVVGACLWKRPEHLLMGCAKGPAILSSVEECHYRKFVVETVSLRTRRMQLSLCDFPDGWLFMSETHSDVSPALITLRMFMVPSSPRSTWVVHIDATHATQTPQFQPSVCKRSGQVLTLYPL